ncbi:MAG TPA: single-stranded-DNA-specific exonuclease RecJ [Thermoleophilaceae bacterium]
MDSKPTRWECEPYDVAAAMRLADGLGVSPVLGTVLARRGYSSAEDAREFLEGRERHDPLSLAGVREACEAIARHREAGSRVVVFGDYDVDGVCSTAILLRALRAAGLDPAWELPSRFGDGYGLSAAAVERLAAAGAGLLITVDCGITAVDEVAAARRAGLEVVVTDHHRPGAELPDCVVVHPALGGFGAPELCGSGVALKLAEALDPSAAADDLELAALATVCDMVPLRGENRRIVREGLRAMARTRKPGLRALMEVAGLEPGQIDERSLGFALGPRLNAAGRMQRADAALELLMTEDGARAQEIARELDLLNRDRREAETRILFSADSACAGQAAAAAMVVAGEGWHPGVVGIVASRLVERWGRPCVVIGLDGHAGRGSGRSISAYDLHAGLAASSAHLRRFGGHRVAAGLEIDAGEVGAFRAALAAHAGEELSPADLIPVERVDAVVPGGLLGLALAEELEKLRPFGAGNPAPTLLVPAARLESVAGMGSERQHARFTLVTGGSRAGGVAFGSAPRALPAGDGAHDLALRLERNRWNGTVEPRVVLRAACPTRRGELRVLGEERPFAERLELALREETPEPGGLPIRGRRDRRGEGVAGVAGDLLTSGDSVLVAVADLPRRRESLERLVAGLARDAMAVARWDDLLAEPALAAPFDHLVALDPPPGVDAATLPGPPGGVAHLAWGPPEVEFALAVWRAELDLRPALVAAYRALRNGGELESSLTGGGRYPRSLACCGRLLRVLCELELVTYADGVCSVGEAVPTELERSATYRASLARLAELERGLGASSRAAPSSAQMAS